MIADRLRRQPPFVWAVLAIGALLFALYAVAVNALVQAGESERSFGWSATTGPQHQMRSHTSRPKGRPRASCSWAT